MSPLPTLALVQFTADDLREALLRRRETDPLFAAIKKHRDQTDDNRCHLDDNELYAAAGLEPARTRLPCLEEFRPSCDRFWYQRQNPDEPLTPGRMTIAQLEAEVDRLGAERNSMRDQWIREIIDRYRAVQGWSYDRACAFAEATVRDAMAEFRKANGPEGDGGG